MFLYREHSLRFSLLLVSAITARNYLLLGRIQWLLIAKDGGFDYRMLETNIAVNRSRVGVRSRAEFTGLVNLRDTLLLK